MKKFLAGIFCVFFTAQVCVGFGQQVEFDLIPVRQVLTNLLQQSKKISYSPRLMARIGRTYALAYAQSAGPEDKIKTPTDRLYSEEQVVGRSFERFEALKRGKERDYKDPFYRDSPPLTNSVAQHYLTNAIAYYQKAIKDGDRSMLNYLGLGWCLKENNQTNEAISNLRMAYKLAKGYKPGIPAGGSVNEIDIRKEVSKYLIPLLDPQKDAREIADIKVLDQLWRPLKSSISPIAISLDGQGHGRDLVDERHAVPFDLDGSGYADEWEWIRPNAGWLVYCPDPAQNKITSGLQLFGNVTFWLFWENGYEALGSLDNNFDGVLTGAELDNLCIWQDLNVNGACESGEVRKVADWGITALGYKIPQVIEGTLSCLEGARFGDKWRPTYDLVLARKRRVFP